jgi:hypothetical protein
MKTTSERNHTQYVHMTDNTRLDFINVYIYIYIYIYIIVSCKCLGKTNVDIVERTPIEDSNARVLRASKHSVSVLYIYISIYIDGDSFQCVCVCNPH